MRQARGGVLVVGGGFAGGYVARLLGKQGATIVSPENFMLYTPMLPEAASGTLEPRHTVVPLRQMCPRAELVLGRVTEIDEEGRVAHVETPDAGTFDIGWEQLVLALGAVPRVFPVPGLAEHGLGFKNLADAIMLRNRVLRQLEAADAELDAGEARAHLGFVFVGAGYAGVEALAELSDLANDALRWYPRLRSIPQRWVLVDAAPKILAEIPTRLGDYAAKELTGRGVEIHVSTMLESFDGEEAVLSNGTRIPARTLVWTAGVKASPEVGVFGMPLDERGRVRVDSFLRVEGRERVWSLGDCAAVPNERTPGPVRPAHLPARAPAGAAAREEPPRRTGAVRLPDAGPGGDARALQGNRGRDGRPLPRLPGLVHHPQLPPLPAAALLAEAARRRRLDDVALLPPRHRRADGPPRPEPARRLTLSGGSSARR